MCRLTTGTLSEKCVVRLFGRCANVIQCTYTNIDSIAYAIRYSLLLLGYKPVQHVTVLTDIASTELPFRVHLGLKLAGPFVRRYLVPSFISRGALGQATSESSVSEERKRARNVR
jgi:hypothetical protein